jgi:acyl carrier protein
MDETRARQLLADSLAEVAPEVDLADVDPSEELAVEADLDSMDFLHLVEAVSNATGRDIPESDYPHLGSVDGFVAYLVEHTPG